MNQRSVWYLAHPLKPDDRFTTEQNMDHIVKLTRIFFDHNIYVCTPYHTCMLALDDTNIEHRNMGIEMDNVVLRRLNKIILVGHKISFGMNEEANIIKEQGGVLKTFVGISDEELSTVLGYHSSEMLWE